MTERDLFDWHWPNSPISIRVDGVPEAEQKSAIEINNALHSFDGYIQHFRSALLLFDFVGNEIAQRRAAYDAARTVNDYPYYCSGPEPRIVGGWPLVAARDGAMTINHFEKTIRRIESALSVKKCPTLLKLIDGREKRAVRKLFNLRFRESEDVRDATAHSAENLPEDHGIVGPFEGFGVLKRNSSGTLFIQGLFGRRYVVTIDGRTASYDLDNDSLQHLIKVRDAYCTVFVKAAKVTKEIAAVARYGHENVPHTAT